MHADNGIEVEYMTNVYRDKILKAIELYEKLAKGLLQPDGTPAAEDLELFASHQDEIKRLKIDLENAPTDGELSLAKMLLETGNPINAHVKYVGAKVHGQERQSRVIVMCAYSAYMPAADRLHVDVVGGSQIGKSTNVTTALETFPLENIIIATEASAKTLYYMVAEHPERLKDATIYIDDAREEHIPILKSFRNDGGIDPHSMTVIDGKFAEMIVEYRPAIIASSITPLRDAEGQATSRAFLCPYPNVTPDEEKLVRTSIKKNISIGALFSSHNTDRKRVLQATALLLRDTGIKDVLIPFVVQEPDGADRRGTGQFMRLIKISAFINQFRRPIYESEDGRKFVLAIPKDLETAATIWFDFAEGQRFKVSRKALVVLAAIPGEACIDHITSPALARDLGMGQRTVERYLKDLFEAGVLSREKLNMPGSPWGWWCESYIRQSIVSQIPQAVEGEAVLTTDIDKKFCLEYGAKYLSDYQLNLYNDIFSINDSKVRINVLDKNNVDEGMSLKDFYLSYIYTFSQKCVVNA